MKKVEVALLDSLQAGVPAYGLVANVDLVLIRWPDDDKQV
jgi:hypothetical protein